jgi:ATP-dependent DNA helicase RecQ
VVTGADTQKIRDFKHDQIKTYGVGRDRDKRFWRRIVENLLAQGGLAQTDGDRPGLYITPKGADVLYGRAKFFILQQKERKPKGAMLPQHAKGAMLPRLPGEACADDMLPQKRGSMAPATNTSAPLEFDAGMFEQLRALRRRLAAAKGLPPFVVFSDRTLHEMAAYFPATDSEMQRITGVGEQKFRQYGREFLASIADYVRLHPEVARRQGNPFAGRPPRRVPRNIRRRS